MEKYHGVNQKQNDATKQAKYKIEYLKNFISQEAIKYRKDLELEKYRHQGLIKEYNFQIDALKEHLKFKSIERKSIRLLEIKFFINVRTMGNFSSIQLNNLGNKSFEGIGFRI